MKHQVLQVLIFAVLTKADRDGHGDGASSSLYPHTFFGGSLGKGSTNLRSGNQHSSFGSFGDARSGKSLNLDAVRVPIEHSQSGNSESFSQLPRIGKAKSFESLSSERNSFQRHTFFDSPLIDHEASSTFGSSNADSGNQRVENFASSGRIGKQNSFESSPRVSQIREDQRPQSQNVQSRNIDQIHEDVQRVVKIAAPERKQLHEDVQRHVQFIPDQNAQNTQTVNKPSQFAFRNSRNEVRTLQQVHEEIEELKRRQNEQRLAQDQHASTQRVNPTEHIQTQQRVVPVHQVQTQQRVGPVHQVQTQQRVGPVHQVQTQQRVGPVHQVQTQQRVGPVHQVQTQQRPIPDQRVHTQQRVIPVEPVQREKIIQQNSHDSSFGSQIRPVQTTFVHHEIEKKFPSQAAHIDESQHIIQNEIPDARRFKDDFRTGKSESLEGVTDSVGQTSTVFGISPSTHQRFNPTSSGFRSSGNHKTGNFVSSGRIGKTNSFEANQNRQREYIGNQPRDDYSSLSIAQLARTGKLDNSAQHNTFFGSPLTHRQQITQPTQEHRTQGSQVFGIREGKSDSLDAPSIANQRSTFFGATPNTRQSSGNFFSSGRIGKANSLEKANVQIPPLVLQSSNTQVHGIQNIPNHQLNQQNPGLENTHRQVQNVQPFQSFDLNHGVNTNFQSQVHGFQNTPVVQIQSLPNIRPEVRGALAQAQNIQLSRPNVQRFPQTVQVHGRTDQQSSRPVIFGAPTQRFVGRTQNFQRFPQTTQVRHENVKPIEEFRSSNQGFETSSHNGQRFPESVQTRNGNLRPFQNERQTSHTFGKVAHDAQIFPQRQIIQTSQVQGNTVQTFGGNSQRFSQTIPETKTIHGIQESSQGFQRGFQNHQQPIQDVNHLGSNIQPNDQFDAHRNSFFERQQFDTNELRI